MPFSPTLKLVLTLLAIVVQMRCRIPMGVALLTGAVLLAVLFALPAAGFASAAWDGLLSEQTIFLLVIVGGLLVFSAAPD